ncbi:uncharacterized protein HMPREF1541_00544 [Cyphellophora europaea CBS 101466]|uniref:Zn(2)-C6 fungal-type domain-containing protein n=1 Tax=Cyphellophora europaea (strain CBS 101466) TaxID=1220924 RepID=W2SCM5_CYPE1|nr:uncharacterized protein HMPREF1541_00544 [Cyphellophora europaea CBS 101466]ETN46360.1 hypothetical protein HMPREF1541_00544 [Cyphellophora europaea CBS 101466]
MNMDNIKDDPERVLSWVPSSPDIDKGNHQSCSLCPLTEISLRSTWMLLTSRLIDRCPQDPMEPDATRRIRCDEAQPFCRNCQSTGRTCEGVAEAKFFFVATPPNTRALPDRSHTASPTFSLASPKHPEELRSFHIFFVRAAPLFSTGALDAGFWKDTIPRLSQSMLFAWDAAISIGLLFENPVYRVALPGWQNHQLEPQQLRALQWYTRSVSRLSQHMDSNPSDEMLALLSCALFTACEFQQGDSSGGFALLDRGLRLLMVYLSPARLRSPVSDTTSLLEASVVPFFTRHAMFMALSGLPLLYDFTSIAAQPRTRPLTARFSEEWATLDAIPQALFDLIYRSNELCRAARLVVHQPYELSRIGTLQPPLLNALNAWRERLAQFSRTAASPEDASKVSYLRLYHLVATILASTCLSPTQVSLDAHFTDFGVIVDLAVEILASNGRPLPPFENGVGPPLFFVATHCRDPVLRRKALKLLHSVPRPTAPSTWTILPVTQIAEQAISFEEGGTTPRHASDVPELRRVHHAQCFLRPRPLARGGGRELALKLITYSESRDLVEHIVDLPDYDQNDFQHMGSHEIPLASQYALQPTKPFAAIAAP